MSRAYEDFPVGQRLVSGGQTISAEEIVAFAQRYDPQPFHLTSNPGENLLGGLVASGWQTAAVSMRLFIETMQVPGGIIGRAIDELRWPAPVNPDDRIRVEIEILESRLSKSKPGYGIVRYRCLTLNQDDKVVQSFLALVLMPTRESMGGEGFEPPTNTV